MRLRRRHRHVEGKTPKRQFCDSGGDHSRAVPRSQEITKNVPRMYPFSFVSDLLTWNTNGTMRTFPRAEELAPALVESGLAEVHLEGNHVRNGLPEGRVGVSAEVASVFVGVTTMAASSANPSIRSMVVNSQSRRKRNIQQNALFFSDPVLGSFRRESGQAECGPGTGGAGDRRQEFRTAGRTVGGRSRDHRPTAVRLLGDDQEVDGSLDFGSFGGGHVARIPACDARSRAVRFFACGVQKMSWLVTIGVLSTRYRVRSAVVALVSSCVVRNWRATGGGPGILPA
jgi:hypothetical protein